MIVEYSVFVVAHTCEQIRVLFRDFSRGLFLAIAYFVRKQGLCFYLYRRCWPHFLRVGDSNTLASSSAGQIVFCKRGTLDRKACMHSSTAEQSVNQTFGIPRMSRIVDGRGSEVKPIKFSAKALFEATDADKAFVHASRFPHVFMDHVPLPAASMPTAAFTGARRRICATIDANGAHREPRFSSMMRRISSLTVMPSSLARFSSQRIWGSGSHKQVRFIDVHRAYLLVPVN